MGVFEGFCQVALNVLHCSAWVKRCLSITALWIWTSAVHALHHKGTKLEYIQRDASSLKKVPSHLAFIIQHKKEKLVINELSKIVVWAFASGIHTVSLYHTSDTLKDQLVLLQKQIVTHHHLMFSSPVPDVQVLAGINLPQDDHDTYSCSGGDYTVLLLSSDDGRRRIVTAATDISRSLMNRQLSVEDLNPQLVNTKLTGRRNFPDPDLVLVCGDTSSTLGYPPWQLRLTEILNLPHHQNVTYPIFFSSLQRYANCNQRFGK